MGVKAAAKQVARRPLRPFELWAVEMETDLVTAETRLAHTDLGSIARFVANLLRMTFG